MARWGNYNNNLGTSGFFQIGISTHTVIIEEKHIYFNSYITETVFMRWVIFFLEHMQTMNIAPLMSVLIA